MSFITLKKELLIQAADTFGVEVDEGFTRPQIIAELTEMGVSWDMYKEAFPDVEEIEVISRDTETPAGAVDTTALAKPKVFTVLLQMTRGNPTYEIRGFRFTRDNPYLPVDEESANYILENVEGFRIASPKDAADFYS